MKDYEIFNRRELSLLYIKRPELKPVKVPSIAEAKTIKVPSINDANVLRKPSIDQIIIRFLKEFDVFVEPRSVGAWNGWDTLSTATHLFAQENSTLHIASTIFMANRSNQINSSAQDWGTWKRWALDHKNFDEYKDIIFKKIDLHNKNAVKDIKELIKKAELHNKNAFKDIKELIKKAELHNETLIKKLLEKDIKLYVSQLIESDNKRSERKQKETKEFLSKSILFIIPIITFFIFSIFVRTLITNNRVETNFSNGKREFNDGNYANARDFYMQALKLNPNHTETKNSFQSLDKIQLQIKSVEFFTNGEQEFKNSNFEKAKDYFIKGLILNPDFQDLKNSLPELRDFNIKGFILNRDFQYTKNNSQDTDIYSKKLFLQGIRAFEEDYFTRGINFFERLLIRNPNFKDAKNALQKLKNLELRIKKKKEIVLSSDSSDEKNDIQNVDHN